MSTTPEKPKVAPNYHEQTDRTFVRAISGEYNLAHELKRLRSLPRVVKGREQPFHSGPQQYSRQYIEPKDGLGQTLHIHLEEYSPGGKSQKHGHVNEAVFYILDGEGAEEHDGVRYEWEAGDAAIVHNNCVHQHFNRNPNRPARALVMKTKPMYMFLNMLFQKTIERTPSEPTPGHEDWQPRNDPFFVDAHEFDHDHGHSHSHSHGE